MSQDGHDVMKVWLRKLVADSPQTPAGRMNVDIVPAQTTSEAVYYTASRHFLDVQFATMDGLDNKAGQYFSVGSTVLTVTFALLNLSQRDVPTYALWALGVALVSYVFLLVFSFFTSLIRGLEYRPDIATLKQHSEEIGGDFLQQWVSNEHLASIEANKPILIRKARWVGAAQNALHIEALLLAVAAILTLTGT